MVTHSQIVKKAGLAREVAARHGVTIHTVRQWIQRDSIPPDYWQTFARDGHASLEQLAAARAATP